MPLSQGAAHNKSLKFSYKYILFLGNSVLILHTPQKNSLFNKLAKLRILIKQIYVLRGFRLSPVTLVRKIRVYLYLFSSRVSKREEQNQKLRKIGFLNAICKSLPLFSLLCIIPLFIALLAKASKQRYLPVKMKLLLKILLL